MSEGGTGFVVVGAERVLWAVVLGAASAALTWGTHSGCVCAAPLTLLAVVLVGAVVSDSLSGRAP